MFGNVCDDFIFALGMGMNISMMVVNGLVLVWLSYIYRKKIVFYKIVYSNVNGKFLYHLYNNNIYQPIVNSIY